MPTRVDDLHGIGWNHLGWRGPWIRLWTVDDPSSPYHGQTLWRPMEGESWLGLVPDEDLFDVESLPDDIPTVVPARQVDGPDTDWARP